MGGVISESHVFTHTWPELGYAAVDALLAVTDPGCYGIHCKGLWRNFNSKRDETRIIYKPAECAVSRTTKKKGDVLF